MELLATYGNYDDDDDDDREEKKQQENGGDGYQIQKIKLRMW